MLKVINWRRKTSIVAVAITLLSLLTVIRPNNLPRAFAVGDGSVIMQTTDGVTWVDTNFSSLSTGALTDIYAVSGTNAYAVGVFGTVAKLNGSGWSDISINIPVEYQGYNFTGVSVFTVPEPSTIVLSVAAVSVLAIMHRARKTAPKRI